MVRLTFIFFIILGIFSCNVFAYTVKKIDLYEMTITLWNQKAVPADRPLSLLTAEVDEVIDGGNREKTIDTEQDKAKPSMEKKHKLENKQKSRIVPLKPAPPSETIKADQEVDFPYDI